LIAKNAKTDRVSVAADACGTSKKICDAKAYLPEPEFLECEILEATEMFSTRVAFFLEKRNGSRNSSSAFMIP
jgi:hypothetical protein